jgi:hypothetical protein
MICNICETDFDLTEEGIEGQIGMIPFRFCTVCIPGIIEWAKEYVSEQEGYDLTA